MTVLILDARVIYDLALAREKTHERVEKIISDLSTDYEIKVSNLVKNRLIELLGIDKALNIIKCFSDYFFEIDNVLLRRIREIEVDDSYSAVEAAYAQICGDAFIVTTCPESFNGSGLAVYGAENLDFIKEKIYLEKLFILEVDDSISCSRNDFKVKYKSYDSGRPSAPYIKVKITNPRNNESMLIDGLINTGADSTFIPVEILMKNKFHPFGVGCKFYNMSNENYDSYPFSVFINIANYEFDEQVVWSWNEDFALIGRDILNTCKITIDGPRECVVFS